MNVKEKRVQDQENTIKRQFFFTIPESSFSEVGRNSLNTHVIMGSSINAKTGASVIDNVSSRCLIVTILSEKKSANLSHHSFGELQDGLCFLGVRCSIRSMVLNKTLKSDLFSLTEAKRNNSSFNLGRLQELTNSATLIGSAQEKKEKNVVSVEQAFVRNSWGGTENELP